MNCEKIREQFADYLTGDLDAESQREIQSHIAACPSCREEIESLSAVWAKLGVLPLEQPSGNLRGRFYSMLEDYKDKIEKAKRAPQSRPSKVWDDIRQAFSFRKPAFVAAFSLALLAVGLGSGFLLSSGGGGDRLADLRREVQDMRQMVSLSLLNQPSASERIQGISWSSRVENPSAKTLEALISTLNTDPNANVRLAAVDALYLFRGHPLVKDSLVQSLVVQDSPLVQVALIDLLVEIREQRAADALKQLIKDNRLIPQVKQRAEQGLQQLI
jgi:hypothetical protein